MKCIALLSGGLDSTLAVKLMLEQGIEVICFNVKSPFCRCNRLKGCAHVAKKASEEFGTEFRFAFFGDEYLEMVKAPPHGYGKNVNPCIDCRIMMFRKAKEVMLETGASFVVSGEVLGQRPMSQHRAALETVEKESGLSGLVLRPLSARLLPPTVPEREGHVDRVKLLAVQGRTRKPQMGLAEQLGIRDYPCPAGGCLLTDSVFAAKLRDAIEHDELSMGSVGLLKLGRHFRLGSSFKLIVGRNEQENIQLDKKAPEGAFLFEPVEFEGPLALGMGRPSAEEKRLASEIVAYYTKRAGEKPVSVKMRGAEAGIIPCEKLGERELERLRV